ncbi:MAG TPA: arginase family protein [Thermomicrobiales bacterium]|nr:arginase family protein [Thermomicrobiales bacterium]
MTLRIVAVPYRYDERNTGLGLGPQALLDDGLLGELSDAGVDVAEPVFAELPDEERTDESIAVNIGRLGAHVGEQVATACGAGNRVLVLAGDDTASVGVISGLQRASGAGHRIGLVWLDAHGDFNTPETSVSNLLAGMPVAILAGLAGPLWRDAAMLAATIPTNRIVIAGVRELDSPEEQLMRSTDVTVLRHAEALDGTSFAAAVTRLAERVDEIYLHVDLDVLDPSLVPSSSTPSPDGMTIRQLDDLLGTVYATGRVGVMGVAGLNPGGGKLGDLSVASMQKLLVAAVPKWTREGGEGT